MEKLARELEVFQPDIVGSTSVTMNFPGAAEIVCKAKDLRPSAMTMMGGPHVSFDAEDTLKRFFRTLKPGYWKRPKRMTFPDLQERRLKDQLLCV